MRLRAVTFDLWHTLLYLDPADEDAYNRAQVALLAGLLQDAPAAGPRGIPIDEAISKTAQEALEASDRGVSVSLAAQALRAATLAGRRLGRRPYAAGLSALVAASPFRAAPGATETLQRLRDAGFAIGVVANTVGEPGRALRKVCDRYGLSGLVGAWSWSDELPWTKPSPEIFRHCLGRLGTPPARAIHVGDGAWDIDGARAAGLRAAVLFTGLARYGRRYRQAVMRVDPTSRSPDHTVRELSQVVPLALRWLPP